MPLLKDQIIANATVRLEDDKEVEYTWRYVQIPISNCRRNYFETI